MRLSALRLLFVAQCAADMRGAIQIDALNEEDEIFWGRNLGMMLESLSMSMMPTEAPIVTPNPTPLPSMMPVDNEPTEGPAMTPTEMPFDQPTPIPTVMPVDNPTGTPVMPTEMPVNEPSASPVTPSPVVEPTPDPTPMPLESTSSFTQSSGTTTSSSETSAPETTSTEVTTTTDADMGNTTSIGTTEERFTSTSTVEETTTTESDTTEMTTVIETTSFEPVSSTSDAFTATPQSETTTTTQSDTTEVTTDIETTSFVPVSTTSDAFTTTSQSEATTTDFDTTEMATTTTNKPLSTTLDAFTTTEQSETTTTESDTTEMTTDIESTTSEPVSTTTEMLTTTPQSETTATQSETTEMTTAIETTSFEPVSSTTEMLTTTVPSETTTTTTTTPQSDTTEMTTETATTASDEPLSTTSDAFTTTPQSETISSTTTTSDDPETTSTEGLTTATSLNPATTSTTTIPGTCIDPETETSVSLGNSCPSGGVCCNGGMRPTRGVTVEDPKCQDCSLCEKGFAIDGDCCPQEDSCEQCCGDVDGSSFCTLIGFGADCLQECTDEETERDDLCLNCAECVTQCDECDFRADFDNCWAQFRNRTICDFCTQPCYRGSQAPIIVPMPVPTPAQQCMYEEGMKRVGEQCIPGQDDGDISVCCVDSVMPMCTMCSSCQEGTAIDGECCSQEVGTSCSDTERCCPDSVGGFFCTTIDIGEDCLEECTENDVGGDFFSAECENCWKCLVEECSECENVGGLDISQCWEDFRNGMICTACQQACYKNSQAEILVDTERKRILELEKDASEEKKTRRFTRERRKASTKVSWRGHLRSKKAFRLK